MYFLYVALGLGLALAMVVLAKHRRGYSLRPVRFDGASALGALANRTATTDGVTGTSANAYRCVTIKSIWNLKNHTVAEGPLIFGYAYSDYSVTEIKEWLE